MTWELILVGFLVGALAGATGVGGGSLMTPILVLFLGFQPTVAIGTDLANGAVFKTAGAWRHRRQGTVHLRLAAWMLLGSAPASLLGVATATYVARTYGSQAHTVEARILAVALLIGGLGLIIRTAVRIRQHESLGLVMNRRYRIIAVATGVIGGFFVGLTSVGSGVFFALVMLTYFPLRSATVVGTDLAHAAALLWVAGLGHLAAGNVDLGALVWLMMGSVPGAVIGASWTLKIPDKVLRMGLAVILVASGIAIAMFPGGTPLAIAIAAFGILLILLGTVQGGRFAPPFVRRLIATSPTPPKDHEPRTETPP